MIKAAPLNGKEPSFSVELMVLGILKITECVLRCSAGDYSCPLKWERAPKFLILNGALGGTRTPDTLVRSQVLYPAELRAQWGMD